MLLPGTVEVGEIESGREHKLLGSRGNGALGEQPLAVIIVQTNIAALAGGQSRQNIARQQLPPALVDGVIPCFQAQGLPVTHLLLRHAVKSLPQIVKTRLGTHGVEQIQGILNPLKIIQGRLGLRLQGIPEGNGD